MLKGNLFQLIIVKPLQSSAWTEPNRKPGDVVWVRNLIAARHLIEAGFAKFPEAGPTETPEAGPSEKKLLGERQNGRSTDSPVSTRSGSGAKLSLLAAGHRLTKRNLR